MNLYKPLIRTICPRVNRIKVSRQSNQVSNQAFHRKKKKNKADKSTPWYALNPRHLLLEHPADTARTHIEVVEKLYSPLYSSRNIFRIKLSTLDPSLTNIANTNDQSVLQYVNLDTGVPSTETNYYAKLTKLRSIIVYSTRAACRIEYINKTNCENITDCNKMCKFQTFLIFLIIITTNVALGKSNKTKSIKNNHNKNIFLKDILDNGRIKRSINNDDVMPFWPNRGKKQTYDDLNDNAMEYNKKLAKSYDDIDKDVPFWGNRGKRDSFEDSSYQYEYPEYFQQHCEHCIKLLIKPEATKSIQNRREDLLTPFWSSRGRRNSLETKDISNPFWGNRGRRQEKEPFWGNRGRRTENEPFWGNRGKREDQSFWNNRAGLEDMEPFWGNRGRRTESEPFWGNRGRREDQSFWNNHMDLENMNPFWGNRGRRTESEPFWGNRGRREDQSFWSNHRSLENVEPFWGNRGRREDKPFWGNRGRRKVFELNQSVNSKEDLKDSILNAINYLENDIENLSRLKKSSGTNSFWANRGRVNRLSLLFNGISRTGGILQKPVEYVHEQTEPGTVLDNRMYVDEPNYILVERSGRSSDEEDPYYISRGKKYYFNYSLGDAARDRRGAIEEIVKSVRNDPYYIARGKKYIGQTNSNSTADNEGLSKAKELICAVIDLMLTKNDGGKVKRDLSDNERDRRTSLKKLAAQLQIDPYFVSRGKKNQVENDQDYLQVFISNVAEKCN